MTAQGPQRRIEVSPQRLASWVGSFAQRHGELTAEPGTGEPGADEVSADEVAFRAADGSIARCAVPFPPLPAGPPGESPIATAGRIAAHACADRTVGVLLVRLGGYAAGVFTGTAPVLAVSKVGSRLVHGRSAAGGTSQRRFARRRENQAHQALAAAADTAAAVFGGYTGRIDVVVLGGDRRALARLQADARLAPYFALATGRVLTVPDPRLSVLAGTPRLFRAITVTITEAGPPG